MGLVVFLHENHLQAVYMHGIGITVHKHRLVLYSESSTPPPQLCYFMRKALVSGGSMKRKGPDLSGVVCSL